MPPEPGASLPSIARTAIAACWGQAPAAHEDVDAPWLQAWGACFVTLTQRGALRGCIGTLQAHRALLADVRKNAVAAALHDPRFAPMTAPELAYTTVEVSWLSPLQRLHFDSEAHAMAQLQPGADGVVLTYGHHCSTFLPHVWAQLPTARDFLAQLKRKAGLPPDFWDATLRLQRYSVRQWTQERSP